MAARGADAEPNQQAAAEGAEWHGQPPMNPNPPGPKTLEIETGQAGLIGPVFDLVFEQVVLVAPLKQPQQASEERRHQPIVDRQGEGDLEVDQVGPACRVDEDVFPLVQVDVGDTAVVHLGQQRLEPRKEFVVHPLPLGERVPVDECPRDCMRQRLSIDADRTERWCDSGDAGEPIVESPFAGREQPTQPAHRNDEDRLLAVELTERLAGGRLVDGRGRPGIVLEQFDQAKRLALNFDDRRRLASAQCPQERWTRPDIVGGRRGAENLGRGSGLQHPILGFRHAGG